MKIKNYIHNNNFISSYYPDDLTFCDDVINWFENHNHLHSKGVTNAGINKFFKSTTELKIIPNHIDKDLSFLFNYINFIALCYAAYVKKWPILNDFASNIEIGPFNIQKYNTNDHFNKLHAERMNFGTLHRVIVWMTYLNDVDEGGHTQFDYYNTKITPSKGLTLLWPSDWTHAHRGCSVTKGNKYIITGWIDLTLQST